MPKLLKQINWVDVVYALFFLGMVYRGTRTGVGAQLLSLAGWVAILYVSVRFYSLFSEAIFGSMLQDWAKPLSFFAIAALSYIVLKFIERILSVVLGSELSVLEKVGGAVVAALRASILFGMIGFLLLLVPVDYLWYSAAKASQTCMKFVNFDEVAYKAIDGFLVTGDEKSASRDVFDDLLNKKRSYDTKKGE